MDKKQIEQIKTAIKGENAAQRQTAFNNALGCCKTDDDYLSLAEICLYNGLKEKTEELLKKDYTLSLQGKAYFLKAQAALLNELPEEAYMYYKQAIASGFNNCSCFLLAASVAQALGKISEAKKLLYQAAEKNPSNPLPFTMLYQKAIDLHDYDKAQEYADELIASVDKRYVSYHAKFIALFAGKRLQEADEMLKGIVDCFGEEEDYIVDKAILQHGLGESLKAKRILESIRHRAKTHRYWETCAIVAGKLKDEDFAISSFRILNETFKDSHAALCLALFAVKDKDFQNGKHYLQQVIDRKTFDVDYYSALYLIAQIKKITDEDWIDAAKKAMTECLIALKISPLNAYVLQYVKDLIPV